MLNVTAISESGSNNILLWAIKNGVNPKENYHLSNLVSNELYYNVIIEGVNFYELFRLTQTYRTKLKIVLTQHVSDLSEDEYAERFNDVDYTKIPELLNKFFALSTQISTDSDVNDELYPRLILPMITTKFNVQVPIGFGDVVNAMSIDDSAKIYTLDYPHNIKQILEIESVRHKILLLISQDMRNIEYDDQIEKLIETTKYNGLTKDKHEIQKIKLISFEKEDRVMRQIIRNTLFFPNKETFSNNIKLMAANSQDTKYTFAIQLPMYLMQLLEASYPEDILEISFRSSIKNLIGNELYIPQDLYESYGIRLMETQTSLVELMLELSDKKFDSTSEDFPESSLVEKESIISLLPAAQLTNAVVSVSYQNLYAMTKHSDSYISELFSAMYQTARSIETDIEKMRK